MTNVDDSLMHFGVKGMKWGIRNKPTVKESRVIAKRQRILNSRRTLSDDDLKKYVSRLSEEKKLKTLIDEDIQPGRSIAKRIVSDSGQKIARTVVAGAGLYAIKLVIEKKFSAKVADEAVKYMVPRPKNK